MKITYDPEVDALYLRLLNEETAESDEIHSNVIVDYTPDQRIRGIEILYASETLDGNPTQVDIELLTEHLSGQQEAA